MPYLPINYVSLIAKVSVIVKTNEAYLKLEINTVPRWSVNQHTLKEHQQKRFFRKTKNEYFMGLQTKYATTRTQTFRKSERNKKTLTGKNYSEDVYSKKTPTNLTAKLTWTDIFKKTFVYEFWAWNKNKGLS